MRFLIRIFMLLVVALVVAVGLFFMLPSERIAKIASQQISAATGREVVMEGDTAISFYPVLGVSAGSFTVANAEWSDSGPMFSARNLKIGVEPQALWGGEVKITGLEAVDPVINLERAADGRVNWELGVEGVAPSGQTTSPSAPAEDRNLALTLDRALITNASFYYTDRGTGQTIRMDGMDFDLRWPNIEERADFDVTLRPAGEAVRLSGSISALDRFIDGEISDLIVEVTAPGGVLNFNGNVGASPEADGALTADISDTARLMTALGLARAEIPPGLGQAITAQSRLTLSSDQRLSLRELVMGLDQNRLTGALDVALAGAKPQVTAQLDAGALDLSGLSGGEATGSSGATSGTADAGWSKAPIDASALALVDAQVALVADSIDLGDLQLGRTRTMLGLTNARMVFELREVQAYEALVTGQFVMNNRSGLSVGGDLKVAGINLETFLTDAVDITRFSGKADASISFLGVGQTQHAILNSLSGQGAVSSDGGVISGIDLDRLMRSGQATGGTTVFDRMEATFRMDQGNLYNDDLLMELPFAKARGEGRLGIGPRDVDYLFTPSFLEGESDKGLAIPVRIRGPWADPSIRPDFEKAIKQNYADEMKELETKAEQKVERAVAEELGVQVEEGEDLEDALRRKVEDEALKGILKLFD